MKALKRDALNPPQFPSVSSVLLIPSVVQDVHTLPTPPSNSSGNDIIYPTT
jgi:hypothetical protein